MVNNVEDADICHDGNNYDDISILLKPFEGAAVDNGGHGDDCKMMMKMMMTTMTHHLLLLPFEGAATIVVDNQIRSQVHTGCPSLAVGFDFHNDEDDNDDDDHDNDDEDDD